MNMLVALKHEYRDRALKLSIDDSKTFVDVLLNPPKPNDALKAAALGYKQVITADHEILFLKSESIYGFSSK
jgi:hypothetical protein